MIRFKKIVSLKAFHIISIFVVIICLSCNSETCRKVEQESTKTKTLNLNLKKARVFLTAKNSEFKLSEIGSANFSELNHPSEFYPTLTIDPNKTFQTIEGFGGAITDASAETFYQLTKEKQDEILTAYFDPVNGIGYTLCRTHINSCDFSSESYAYSEVDNDIDLKHFSIEKDKKYRIPLIQSALKKANNNLAFIASPWSPPAWMKTNNSMLEGGKLKPEYKQTWANYYIRFIEEYEKEGIPICGLTVQNEPMTVQGWESCIYTSEEEKDFVKNFLGPTFANADMSDKKIIIGDYNRGIMHPFDNSKLSDWNWGEVYGKSIIKDLNNSSTGWLDRNILLDENGGPNHVANFCYAPLIGNTKTGEVIYMNSYYYLGHFSKFIKPGARRIVCSSSNNDIMATAMLNPNGSLVVVAMNQTDKKIDYKVEIEKKGVKVYLPPHSISTIIAN